MSKVFEQNLGKARSLSQGVRKNFKKVESLGITLGDLDTLDADAEKAEAMIKEVDALKDVLSAKREEAYLQLDKVKERALKIRQTVKNSFPQEKWIEFGLPDKR